MFADDFLPVYDVSDEVATVVDAEPQLVWEALMDVDLLDVGKRVPLAGVLGALRMLPEIVSHLLHGERPPHAPESMRLRELAQMQPDQGGWILLGERPGEEIALGLVGKFWRPVIQYAQVSPASFTDFDEPGYGKTIYDLSVRTLPDGRSLLSGLMRTATTDEHARRWFRRYWTFGVGSGAHVLVHALLETVRDTAERGTYWSTSGSKKHGRDAAPARRRSIPRSDSQRLSSSRLNSTSFKSSAYYRDSRRSERYARLSTDRDGAEP